MHMYIYTYIYVYIYICVCINSVMYAYTCIHTHLSVQHFRLLLHLRFADRPLIWALTLPLLVWVKVEAWARLVYMAYFTSMVTARGSDCRFQTPGRASDFDTGQPWIMFFRISWGGCLVMWACMSSAEDHASYVPSDGSCGSGQHSGRSCPVLVSL